MKTPRRPSSAQVIAVARWIVLAAAIVCVAVGLLGSEQIAVYWKAATICLECIGIA